MTRQPLWEQIVSYGAVGGTKAPDLMSYPPAGFRPFEQRVRIGHGEARWSHAWHAALTWGIQRNSGMKVTVVDAPGHIAEGTYTPVSFDTAGTPIAPVSTSHEAVYDASGMAFAAPGDTAVLEIPVGPFHVSAPCRVIYIIDEPKRKGFAYGTLSGHPASGEESFIVSQTDDGSVWLTIRSFSRPATGTGKALSPAFRIAQRIFTRRYFRALSGPLD